MSLLGSIWRDRRRERGVAEEVEHQIIVVRTQKANFCLHGSVDTLLVGQCQEVIAETYIGYQAIVEELQRWRTGHTLVVADIHNTAVTPPADRFVGG